jgi:hypothetical protein
MPDGVVTAQPCVTCTSRLERNHPADFIAAECIPTCFSSVGLHVLLAPSTKLSRTLPFTPCNIPYAMHQLGSSSISLAKIILSLSVKFDAGEGDNLAQTAPGTARTHSV